MAVSKLTIGIAGAGVGGLAAGAALAADGHDVTIFDQFDAPAPVGSGLVIQPIGQEVLRHIGALNAALSHGHELTRMIGRECRRDRKILDVSYNRAGNTGRFGLGIHRAALFHVLLQAVRDAGVTFVSGHKVLSVTQDAPRRMEFSDNRVSQVFDLIIDATGARSPLSPLKARALPYGAVWGTVDWPTDTSLPTGHLLQKYRAASTMIGILPIGRLPGDQVQKAAIFWSLTRDGLEHWKKTPISHWKSEATTLWPEMAPFLEDVSSHEDMTPAFYSHGTLKHPVEAGLVHIGDATHRTSPQLGQGANMALLDAWALRNALRAASYLSDALTVYHRSRKRHIWIYQLMSAMFTPLYQSDSRILPILRDHLLAPVTQIPPVPLILEWMVSGRILLPSHRKT